MLTIADKRGVWRTPNLAFDILSESPCQNHPVVQKIYCTKHFEVSWTFCAPYNDDTTPPFEPSIVLHAMEIFSLEMRETLPWNLIGLSICTIACLQIHNAHAFDVKPKTTSPPTARVYQRPHVEIYCVESRRSDSTPGEKLPRVDTVRKYLLLLTLLGFWTWLS